MNPLNDGNNEEDIKTTGQLPLEDTSVCMEQAGIEAMFPLDAPMVRDYHPNTILPSIEDIEHFDF